MSWFSQRTWMPVGRRTSRCHQADTSRPRRTPRPRHRRRSKRSSNRLRAHGRAERHPRVPLCRRRSAPARRKTDDFETNRLDVQWDPDLLASTASVHRGGSLALVARTVRPEAGQATGVTRGLATPPGICRKSQPGKVRTGALPGAGQKRKGSQGQYGDLRGRGSCRRSNDTLYVRLFEACDENHSAA